VVSGFGVDRKLLPIMRQAEFFEHERFGVQPNGGGRLGDFELDLEGAAEMILSRHEPEIGGIAGGPDARRQPQFRCGRGLGTEKRRQDAEKTYSPK
jgi:hypothetical protein